MYVEDALRTAEPSLGGRMCVVDGVIGKQDRPWVGGRMWYVDDVFGKQDRPSLGGWMGGNPLEGEAAAAVEQSV